MPSNIIIDKLAYSSALRNRSPFLKSAFAVGALLLCVAARSFVISGILLLCMSALTVGYSKTSLPRYLKFMTAPFAFLLLGTVAIAVSFSDHPLDLWSVSLGSHYLTVSRESLLYAIRLIVVSLASVSCLYFLALTTPMLDILTVLARIHCPWLIIELMMLIYRYIFVLLDMASSILTAQSCRLGNRDLKTAINSMGQMLSVLLVRAMTRSGQLFDAMESRCYDGKIRVLSDTSKAFLWEKLAVILFLVFLAAVSILCKQKGW